MRLEVFTLYHTVEQPEGEKIAINPLYVAVVVPGAVPQVEVRCHQGRVQRRCVGSVAESASIALTHIKMRDGDEYYIVGEFREILGILRGPRGNSSEHVISGWVTL
jgi:hypothetical protein